MPVQILKLTNGETVMADVVDVVDKVVTLLNPVELKLEPTPKPSNRINMIAYQWLPMVKGKNLMYISESHIIAISHASNYMVDYYKESVDGIIFPEKVQAQQMKEILEEYEDLSNNEVIYH
jgi:hypothetical protein